MARATIVLDCSCLDEPDLAAVELIAQLRIALRRRGFDLQLGPCSSLVELIGFVGLAEVLRVEPCRQAEDREQPRASRKVGELGGPPA